MKVLMIADIHGNNAGLKAVLDSEPSVDKILCAGDITGYHPFINEVIDLFKKYRVVSVKGNHDQYLLDGCAPPSANATVKKSVERMKTIISNENLAYLRALPDSLELSIEGKSVFICHGSPWDLHEGRIYPDDKNFDRFSSLPYDIVVYGQTHYSLMKKVKSVMVLNPGSCGQPRDFQSLSYIVWDTGAQTFENKRIPLQ